MSSLLIQKFPQIRLDASRNMAQAVRAVDESKNRPSDPRNQELIRPTFGDPQDGNLETPINSSGIVKTFINNLPAYRKGLSAGRRGLEVGMAHGYWLIGPFAKLGPLRDTDVANLAGLLSTISLLIVSSICISLYAASNPPKPVRTVPAIRVPDAYDSPEGWNEYASSFLVGGIGGALFAYALLALDITRIFSGVSGLVP